MEAFATVKDLESRWRVMDSAEKKRAEVLLQDAAAIIASEMKYSGVKVDGYDKEQNANLVRVSCEMVLRVMEPDVPQEAWGVGAVVPRPSALYVSKQEKKSLGIGRQRIGVLSMMGD
jgi:hypothetical protein